MQVETYFRKISGVKPYKRMQAAIGGAARKQGKKMSELERAKAKIEAALRVPDASAESGGSAKRVKASA